jgi:type I restriction enzyme S subunit
VPKLRFPEFEKDGEWVEKTVGDVYNFKVTNSFSREYLNNDKGRVKNIHYGDIHTKFNTLFDITKENVPFINQNVSIEKIKKESYCIEGDIIFADASEDLNDVGKSIEIVNLNNEKLVSGLHTLLARQRKNKIAIGFGGYLFKSDWIRKQIEREAQGAKVLGISASRISNVKISFPKDSKEQQKIASCLSALDELITAQAEKIEQLQQHKKGLMQGLFPKIND